MIPEAFLHYIWQFQHFKKKELKTTKGETLKILSPGIKNTAAGPDFSQGKILLNGVESIGNIEIHIKSSDWNAHQHNRDTYYDTVVLHVVWIYDKIIYRTDKSKLPTLVLKERVSMLLIEQYGYMMKSSSPIPCSSHLKQVASVHQMAMLDKMLFRRLQKKTEEILDDLKKNQHDWAETSYQYLVKYFGMKVNNEHFLRLAKSLPLKILQKHSDQPLQIEALLFGQSGLLERTVGKDTYWENLSKEYNFLLHKYDLRKSKIDDIHWKFLRLRPANFPTIRIAQLAALLNKHPNFFSQLLFIENLQDIQKALRTQQSSYWQHHYVFGKVAKKPVGKIGKKTIDTLIINTVVPLLAAYTKYKDNEHFMQRAIEFLEQIRPESNRMIRDWEAAGIQARSAFDTQSLITLYEDFCTHKRCLSCEIGIKLIGSK